MLAGRAGKSTKAKPKRARLRQALLEDWAARRFHVKYQPQVNLRTGKIARFEALLRWDNPALGTISPKLFIPLAEEMGLIWEIGQWVLEQACADAMSWPQDIGIAVNVSAISLRDPALPFILQQAMTQSGLIASRLELEITETAAIIMDTENLGNLNAIQQLGVRITIDDLDVDHSSLKYLLDFPFDKIKVDGLYAAALSQPGWRGEAARQIMGAIAGLCRNLKIASLAEGVETEQQLAAVMEADFTEVQGYIFGDPVGADKVPECLLHMQTIWKNLAIPKQPADAVFSFLQSNIRSNGII